MRKKEIDFFLSILDKILSIKYYIQEQAYSREFSVLIRILVSALNNFLLQSNIF